MLRRKINLLLCGKPYCNIIFNNYFRSFLCTDKEEIITISKKVRLRLTETTLCDEEDKKEQFLVKLEQRLLSPEVSNFPCRIIGPHLRCRSKHGQTVVSVTFEVQMDQNVISTSKFCNNTCLKCQMEERLRKMIAVIRTLLASSKLNVSVDDQTISVKRTALRIANPRDGVFCLKDKPGIKKKSKRCLPGTYFDIISQRCENCSRGSYQPNRSETFCFRCPRNKTTLYSGAKNISQCTGNSLNLSSRT